MHHKTKFNNSYETEPSSCSASPSCDNSLLEGSKISIEEMNSKGISKLSDLLQPVSFKDETITSEININNTNLKMMENMFKFKPFEVLNLNEDNLKYRNVKEELKTDRGTNDDYSSSQEPSFKGFPDEIRYNKDDSDSEENSLSSNRLIIDEDRDSSFNSNSMISKNLKSNQKPESDNISKVLLKENIQQEIIEKSPDLFECDDDDCFNEECNDNDDRSEIETTMNLTEIFDDQTKTKNRNTDIEILKRIKDSLSGVPPPPSVTITQINLFDSVIANKENILKFNTNSNEEEEKYFNSLFKPTHSLDEIQKMSWPEILNAKHHGLHYNISTVTEKIELLCMSVVERYIGVETSSSFRALSSNIKRANTKLKSIQSPGSRLSHLAKRRAAFSSATLQSTFQKQVPKAISSRQILVDTKKGKIKTPKRKTPGKCKNARKLTSSAKKRAQEKDLKPGGPTRETSKRALFQSPPDNTKLGGSKIIPKPITFKPEIANRVEKSKRALFSPDKSLSIENEMKRKRSNLDDDNSLISNPSKMIRTDFENITPRSLKFKSQSFCIGSGTNSNVKNLLNNVKGKTLVRASSDTVCSSQLTESHRKKLLWAVSQALQTKQIGVEHPKFKQYAAVLARAIKRLFMEFYLNLKNASTSDTMLRLSKKYVHCVLLDMSSDDIYLNGKTRLENERLLLASKKTNSGYIAPEDYENIRVNNLRKIPSSSIFSDNSCDSFNLLSQSYTQNSQQIYSSSTEFLSQISDDSVLSKSNNSDAIKLQIINEINNQKEDDNNRISKLQNSSSKSNLYGIALRENVDCEQRKSAQKNFTGKDMKNTSPYIIENLQRSDYKHRNQLLNLNNYGVSTSLPSSELNKLKVKRQITFDN